MEFQNISLYFFRTRELTWIYAHNDSVTVISPKYLIQFIKHAM